MHTYRKTAHLISLSATICILFFALGDTTAFAAAEYVPLVGIPGLSNTPGTRNLPDLVNKTYIVLIGFGALAAAIKIAFAGIKWSMSDIITDKSQAKEDIKGSLLGLALLLIPYIVFKTINPDILNLDILKGAVRIDLTEAPAAQVETLQQRNERIIDACIPAPGKQVSPACPQNVTVEDKAAATSCSTGSGGYYDPAINTCITRSSTADYDTAVGAGQYNSTTGSTWDSVCGSPGNVVVTPLSGTMVRYSCKQ